MNFCILLLFFFLGKKIESRSFLSIIFHFALKSALASLNSQTFFRFQAASATPALLKTPLTQSQQAYSTAFNTARALNAAGLAQVQAQAQPVTAASYAALSGWVWRNFRLILSELIFFIRRYGREYTDPYLGHGIGPVPGYQVRLANKISKTCCWPHHPRSPSFQAMYRAGYSRFTPY